MVNLNILKSKKLPLGVFAGVPRSPQPATIYITLTYNKKFDFLRGLAGFQFLPKGSPDPQVIKFRIPVMPPTIKEDFGNSNDSENVVRMGEVVLPKFKKAKQFRWESFFPYDTRSKYLSTTTRNLSWSSLSNLKNQATSLVQDPLNALMQAECKPAVYVKIFKTLTETTEPLTISMTFYEGGSINATKVTLDSFDGEYENNGDYKYEISLVEWTDISPKLLNQKGDTVASNLPKVADKIKFKSIRNLKDFYKWAKQMYPVVSTTLVMAFATYNGVRNLVFDGILKAWKIKGSLQDLGGRFGIISNIFGLSKITSKDTRAVSSSLKKLSFTKASKQAAELLNQNKMYRS